MRKYISMIAIAIAAAFATSCTNDEIEVSSSISFKLVPSGVMSPFTYEMSIGELSSFNTNYKLRTRILVYGENGLLAGENTAYLTNYNGIQNASMYLPKGNYTVLALTDVVKYSGSEVTFEYWKLTDEQNINTAKVTDAGYIGYEQKVLGIDTKKITIADGNENFTLTPKPAGSLFIIIYENIHYYSGVESYELAVTRISDNVTFNSNGEYIPAVQNKDNEYKWRISSIDIADFPNSTSIYSYGFMFPIENIKFRYRAWTTDEEYIPLGIEYYGTIAAGEEYMFDLNLNDGGNITTEAAIVNNPSTARAFVNSTSIPFRPDAEVKMQKMEDNKLFEASKSALVRDLIK